MAVESNDPFATEATVGSDFVKIQDYYGELVIVWAREFKRTSTKYKSKENPEGMKDSIRADFAVITGDRQDLHEDALIFGGFLVGSLKALAGKNYKVNKEQGDADREDLRPFLGRIVQGKEEILGNLPSLFEEPTDADRKVAIKWLEDNKPEPKDPFSI